MPELEEEKNKLTIPTFRSEADHDSGVNSIRRFPTRSRSLFGGFRNGDQIWKRIAFDGDGSAAALDNNMGK